MEGNKHRCVNKTSCDKGGACANEKRKRCNRIPSEITLGRNYPSAGYNSKYADGFSQFLLSFVVPLCSSYVALVVIIRLPTFTKNNQTQIFIIKFNFSSKDLPSLNNISFAYSRAAICIQGWLKCDMSLV